jgi:hypothetical protein
VQVSQAHFNENDEAHRKKAQTAREAHLREVTDMQAATSKKLEGTKTHFTRQLYACNRKLARAAEEKRELVARVRQLEAAQAEAQARTRQLDAVQSSWEPQHGSCGSW